MSLGLGPAGFTKAKVVTLRGLIRSWQANLAMPNM